MSRLILGVPTAAVLASVLVAGLAQAAQLPQDRDLAALNAVSGRCVECHETVVVERHGAGDVHADITCIECHPGRGNPHVVPAGPPGQGALLARLSGVTAMSPSSIAACATCHPEPVAGWIESAHGPTANHAGSDKHPTCRRCHGPPHLMVPAVGEKATMLLQCIGCHGFSDEGFTPTRQEVVDTYRDTIHGKMLRLGNENVAWCGDCHGAHAVFGPQDPRSSVSEGNRVATCAKCHEGANQAFSHAVSHTPTSIDRNFWAGFVALMLSALTLGTIALLAVHVGLDFYRALRGATERNGGEGDHAAAVAEIHRDDEVPRFGLHARLQHWGMMLSFTTLVLSGWPLKSAAVGGSPELVEAVGGAVFLSTVHRAAGGLLLAVSLYHLVWVILGVRQGRVQLAMIPGLKDVTDAFGNILYFLGMRKERPRFGRYTYYEKFDYWAVFWGMAIMGTTGLALWFPVLFSTVVGGGFIEIAMIAHSDEALLAALAIFVWHFYNVHLRPTIFPMSWVWLTGRISAHALYEEHRGEYVARFGERPPSDHDKPTAWWAKAGWSIAGLWTVLIVSAAVLKADFDVLTRRIEELSHSPVLEAAAEGRHQVTRGAARTTLVVAQQFDKCLSCHDADDYAFGDEFPHEDHFDDYFDGEVEIKGCADCHALAWHEKVETSNRICLECHDADGREVKF